MPFRQARWRAWLLADKPESLPLDRRGRSLSWSGFQRNPLGLALILVGPVGLLIGAVSGYLDGGAARPA